MQSYDLCFVCQVNLLVLPNGYWIQSFQMDQSLVELFRFSGGTARGSSGANTSIVHMYLRAGRRDLGAIFCIEGIAGENAHCPLYQCHRHKLDLSRRRLLKKKV